MFHDSMNLMTNEIVFRNSRIGIIIIVAVYRRPWPLAFELQSNQLFSPRRSATDSIGKQCNQLGTWMFLAVILADAAIIALVTPVSKCFC